MKFLIITIPITLFLSFLGTKALAQKNMSAFDGTYDVELTIKTEGQPDVIFHDEMDLRGVEGPIPLASFFRGPITGEMRVPNSFVSPLKGQVVVNFGWAGYRANFDFQIRAKENGHEYNVYYKGASRYTYFNTTQTDEGRATILGQAYVDGPDQTKKLMGTFKAVRRDQ